MLDVSWRGGSALRSVSFRRIATSRPINDTTTAQFIAPETHQRAGVERHHAARWAEALALDKALTAPTRQPAAPFRPSRIQASKDRSPSYLSLITLPVGLTGVAPFVIAAIQDR